MAIFILIFAFQFTSTVATIGGIQAYAEAHPNEAVAVHQTVVINKRGGWVIEER